MTEKTLTYDELLTDLADVYAQMGYGDAAPDAATQRETEAVAADVRRWLRPRFCFRVVSQLPPFGLGPIIGGQLRGAEAYALFIATGGTELETYLRQLTAKGDMVRTFVADALGSVVAERCADRMEQCLQQSIEKLGWHRTNRFSPGYCGWDVGEQRQLFALFGGHTCGVSLTDAALMVPVKSVSGIIGLGTDVRRLPYRCALCDAAHCYRRR